MTTASAPAPDGRTERLDLFRPTHHDVDAIFTICADPRVWTHFPSLRHTRREQSAAVVDRWMRGWAEHGLDVWTVRGRDEPAVLGYGGCSLRAGAFWNLGYRIAPAAQGHGIATEVAAEGARRARALDPDLPVVAYLLEHNAASAAVARRLGMTLVHRGPDAGNPDPDAVRLVYTDRPLTTEQLAATMR